MESKISIMPYCEVDGIRTLKDSQVKNLFKRMQADGTSEIVFLDGSIKSATEFLNAFKYNQSSLLYIVYYEGVEAAIFWLTRPQSRWAQFNFCIFKEYWGDKAHEIAAYVLKTVITMKDEDGYLFDALLGVISSRNSYAVKFAINCGWTPIGVFKNGIWNYKEKKSEDAVLVSFDRRCLKKCKFMRK